MGSLEQACIAGFLCRLCSEMHRTVIHIYGDQGLQNNLAEKINTLLPVTITPSDALPKTVCSECMAKVLDHYKLFKRIHKTNAIFGGALNNMNNSTPTNSARTTNSAVENNSEFEIIFSDDDSPQLDPSSSANNESDDNS